LGAHRFPEDLILQLDPGAGGEDAKTGEVLHPSINLQHQID
jgi:hypothetical protein